MSAYEQGHHTEQVLTTAALRLRDIEERTGIRAVVQYGEPASDRTISELSDFDIILCLSNRQEGAPPAWTIHFAPLTYDTDRLVSHLRVLGRRLATDLKQTSPTLALTRFLDGLDKVLTAKS
jgi:hypothetical protein